MNKYIGYATATRLADMVPPWDSNLDIKEKIKVVLNDFFYDGTPVRCIQVLEEENRAGYCAELDFKKEKPLPKHNFRWNT